MSKTRHRFSAGRRHHFCGVTEVNLCETCSRRYLFEAARLAFGVLAVGTQTPDADVGFADLPGEQRFRLTFEEFGERRAGHEHFRQIDNGAAVSADQMVVRPDVRIVKRLAARAGQPKKRCTSARLASVSLMPRLISSPTKLGSKSR